jgi:hypothetical protein
VRFSAAVKTGVLLLALLLAGEARAQALTQCNQGRVNVEVKLDYQIPRYDTTMTAVQIDAKFRDDHDTTLPGDRGSIYVGLTRSVLEVRSAFQFESLVNKSRDAACLSVKKAVFTVIYHPQVYIASDYLRMACSYGVTVLHERRHVDTYVRTLNEYVPQFRHEVDDYIARIPPSQPIRSQGEISGRQQQLAREVADSLKPALERFKQANRGRQAAIDSPEAYARDQAVCPGEQPAFPKR